MGRFNYLKNKLECLMGNDFISKFTNKELISYYGKMLIYKYDIKDKNKIIGYGIYLDTITGLEVNVLTREFKEPIISICKVYKNDEERKRFAEINHYLNCSCLKCNQIMVINFIF